MNPSFEPDLRAQALAQAWHGAPRVSAADLPIADDVQAYAVQEALASRLGPVAAWKVGASSDNAEPNASPLPAAVVRPAGSKLALPPRSMRLIELEVAVRLRHDLRPGDRLISKTQVWDAIESVFPVVEVVDSRLIQGRDAPAPVRLADLQSHGALVWGAPREIHPRAIHLTRLRTRLWFDGVLATDVTGAHAAPDIWRLIAWLARHAQARGRGLRAGDNRAGPTPASAAVAWATRRPAYHPQA